MYSDTRNQHYECHYCTVREHYYTASYTVAMLDDTWHPAAVTRFKMGTLTFSKKMYQWNQQNCFNYRLLQVKGERGET